MRFSNILLVLDSAVSSTVALSRAVALARSEHASLTVCDVVDTIPADYRRAIVAVTPEELINSVAATKLEKLESVVKSADANDLDIKVTVLVGKPHVEIARQVRQNGHDLVIKPTTGRRAIRGLSTKRDDRDLMRSCPCPVWLVNAADRTTSGCILAALDMPADGATRSALNDHILDVSRSIALAEFRQLHIVHTWRLTGESRMRSRGTRATDLEVDRMVAREAVKRTIWLRDTVNAVQSDSHRAATDYLAPELHVLKGTPQDIVPDLAEELGAGLIIMGTAARTGVPGFWLGNTSERVLSRSDSSFLIVKQPSPSSPSKPAAEMRQQVEHSGPVPHWRHF